MTARRIDADALLDLATEMLRAEVLPALGAGGVFVTGE